MPDGDRIERSIPRGWRSAYRCLKGGARPDQVLPHLMRAAAATLRACGATPFLTSLGDVVDACARGEVSQQAALRTATSIQRAQGGGYESLMIADAAKRAIVATAAGSEIREPGSLRVAQAVVFEMMDKQLFERVRPNLVGDVLGSHAELDAFKAECYARPEVRRLAERLVRHPDGVGLRAPAVDAGARAKRSMADVLRDSLLA